LDYKFRNLKKPQQEQGREESQQQGNSISQVPDINQVSQQKKQLEEELDQPPKKEAEVLEWICDLISERMGFVRSQRIFVVHKTNLLISGIKLQEPTVQNYPA
jgi:hypothetical protein